MNSGKANIECLIYFPSLIPYQTKLFVINKDANIILFDIPYILFNL